MSLAAFPARSALGGFVRSALGARGGQEELVLGGSAVVIRARGDSHPALCGIASGVDCVIDVQFISPAITTLSGPGGSAFRLVGQTGGVSIDFPAGGSPWCGLNGGAKAAYEENEELHILFTDSGDKPPGNSATCAAENWGFVLFETLDVYLPE